MFLLDHLNKQTRHSIIFIDIYHLQMKVRKGNVFRSLCQEFCPQGRGKCTPWADTPRQTHHPRPDRHPSPNKQMATAADGTHPTEIHSCFLFTLVPTYNKFGYNEYPAVTSKFLARKSMPEMLKNSLTMSAHL